MAEEWANNRCPEQGPEFIVWCMCKEDFLAGYQAAKDETNLPTPAKWISVKERLPEEGVEVLTFDGRWVTTGYKAMIETYKPSFPQFNNIQMFHWVFCGPLYDEYNPTITHWMPLPKPPKGEG